MKTKLASLVASLSLLTTLSACGSPPSPDPASTSAAGESTSAIESAPEFTYVAIDEALTGYELTTLNSGTKTHVGALVLSAVRGEAKSLTEALATPGTVAARGSFRGSDEFAVEALYRALPDGHPVSTPTYYIARVGAGAHDTATEVNVGGETPFDDLDVSAALVPFETASWVTGRVLEGGALVAGSIASGVFRAGVVFVRLPDDVRCDEPTETCEPGHVATFTRDANRCLVAAGCERRAACPLDIIACEPGYVRTSWPGAHGCHAFACDPAFDPAP
jgi:hypothetical protein